MSDTWKRVPAAQIARIEIGATPARNTPIYWARNGQGHLWVSIKDMHDSVILSTAEHITDQGVRGSSVKLVPAGTPLMSFKLTIGRVAVAGHNLYTNEAIAAFHVDESAVSPRWLFHCLPRSVAQITTDTAIKGATLNKTKLRALPLNLPPLSEQRRIAEILDTLDETIRKTEEVIAKLEQMKQGLLHDLLTRGIDENGELRDPERHPELFKESVLGRVPREWEIMRTEDYCHSVADGTHDSPSQTANGYPLITSKNLKNGELDWSDVTYISERDYRAIIARSWLQPGDILFGMIGTIGNPVALKESEHEIAPKNVGLFRLAGNRAKSLWLLAVLDSQLVERQLAEAMAGSTQKFVGLGTLRGLLIPVPTPDESDRITIAIDQINTGLDKERQQLQKLKVLKQGLMDDLLTGRVRIGVAEEVPA